MPKSDYKDDVLLLCAFEQHKLSLMSPEELATIHKNIKELLPEIPEADSLHESARSLLADIEKLQQKKCH